MDEQRRREHHRREDTVTERKSWESSAMWDQHYRDMAKEQSLSYACVLTFFVIHKSCHPSFCIVSHCAVIDWGRQLVIHEHHRRSIRFSLSAFNGRLFYSLIKWDSTLPPRSHLSLSLHDNQLMHVQTPPGSATYNNPDKGYRGNSAKHWSAAVSFPSTTLLKCKGLTSCGHIFISCSGLFILVGGVYVELSFPVYYTANDRSVSLTPLASFK